MNDRFQISDNDTSNSEHSISLTDLKKEVELTTSQLNHITQRQQFISLVITLNNNAKNHLNQDKSKQALVYLNQAEKILEFAANCGKKIDRNLIICILHNEASSYQKLWEYEKCSNYLQALIFNYNSNLKSNDQNEFYPKTFRMKEYFADKIEKHAHLAQYYLQFCAVNSQINNHSVALIAARKSIQTTKQLFNQFEKISSSLSKQSAQRKGQFQQKLTIIDYLSRINDKISINQYEQILLVIKVVLNKWKKTKNIDHLNKNVIMEAEFKNFSIGSLIHIIPKEHVDTEKINEIETYSLRSIIKKLIIFAVGYFTIATELRMIANQKYKGQTLSKKNSIQYKESEIYHLFSIFLICFNLPFDILYLKHILGSYENNYSTDLNLETQGEVDEFFVQNWMFSESKIKDLSLHISNDFLERTEINDKVFKAQLKKVKFQLISIILLPELSIKENQSLKINQKVRVLRAIALQIIAQKVKVSIKGFLKKKKQINKRKDPKVLNLQFYQYLQRMELLKLKLLFDKKLKKEKQSLILKNQKERKAMNSMFFYQKTKVRKEV